MIVTFEEKIKYITFSAIGGFFTYLTIGLLIKSAFFSNHLSVSDFYELFRDGLTVTAYYLAPAAAILLFSDWRLEHVEKNKEKHAEDIYNLQRNLYTEIRELESEIENEDSLTIDGQKALEDRQKQVINELYKFENLSNEFEFEDAKSKEYKQLAKDLLYEYREMFWYLGLMYSSLIKISDPVQYNKEYIDEADDEFEERYRIRYQQDSQNYHEAFGRAFSLREQFKPLKDALKIKPRSPN